MTMAVCTLVTITAGVLVCFECIAVDRAFANLAFIGTVLVLVGIFGMCYFCHYLGRFWSARTRIDQGHRIIKTGPYAVVRHPIYTAAIVMYSGLAMVFPVWWNLLAVFVMNMCYVLKTQDEDKYLREHLTGYHEYAQRVPYRLVPRIG